MIGDIHDNSIPDEPPLRKELGHPNASTSSEPYFRAEQNGTRREREYSTKEANKLKVPPMAFFPGTGIIKIFRIRRIPSKIWEEAMKFSVESRREIWDFFSKEVFDLLIIGGGITGAGIARDGAYRGLKVALVERADFASGTSSRSSKLIHGGLRYLEHFELGLVFESVQERYLLMNKLAPHLVRPLPFIIPVWKDSKHGMFITGLGLTLYDGLAFFRNYRNHQKFSVKRIEKEEPTLNCSQMKGGFLYYDGQTFDGRLTLETLISAFEKGALGLNYIEAGAPLLKDGKVCGVGATDLLSGKSCEIQAKCVINATGPMADRFLQNLKSHTSPLIRPTKGIHIILSQKDFPLSHAVTFASAVDQRIMFLLPWGDFTLIGTTDTASPAELEGMSTREDVEYILESMAYIQQGPKIEFHQIISSYAGWRPLIAEEGSESDISRKHKIFHHNEGVLTIGGGKLTTYRRMAQEIVDYAIKHFGLKPKDSLSTKAIPLPGSEKTEEIREGDIYGSRRNLVNQYLNTPEKKELLVEGLPYQKGEISFFVHEEMAMNLKDVLLRRTDLALKTADHAVLVAEVAAKELARELGWTEEEREKQLEEYRDYARRALAWRE